MPREKVPPTLPPLGDEVDTRPWREGGREGEEGEGKEG